MYKSLMAAARFADWLTTIIMEVARALSLRASYVADAAEGKAYNGRVAANKHKLKAAERAASKAKYALIAQQVAFDIENEAIAEAHKGYSHAE